MKKFYEIPEIEISELLIEDILTSSNDDTDESEDEVIMDGEGLFDNF